MTVDYYPRFIKHFREWQMPPSRNFSIRVSTKSDSRYITLQLPSRPKLLFVHLYMIDYTSQRIFRDDYANTFRDVAATLSLKHSSNVKVSVLRNANAVYNIT